MDTPMLSLRGVWREFQAGGETVAALRGVDLDIQAGEMVAIVGASGSGKSTLMNVLGCLDRATQGTYQVAGRDVARLDAQALAALRREHFGFIFQRYHLLGDLTAVGNVEMPAIYGDRPAAQRRERARTLLQRLGLGERLDYRPGQLSGGQQQRVSIARALMNGGDVILADEPTGALDTRSGREVMDILQSLHRNGHTIILVTHDMAVARHAQRIIEISDGSIVADRRVDAPTVVSPTPVAGDATATGVPAPAVDKTRARAAGLARLGEALRMALLSMRAHRLRTFLTMLGIIIGIASVVSVVALGEGSRLRIAEQIGSMGTNTIEVRSGRGFGDMQSARVNTLVPADAVALGTQPYVDSVTPVVNANVTVRYRNVSATASIVGVSEQFFRVRGYDIAQGVAFDADSVRRLGQDAVIDENTRTTLFPNGEPAIGQVILLGAVPVRIIGVTAPKELAFGNSDSLNVWIPYTTAISRLQGRTSLRQIVVRVDDDTPMAQAEARITQLLTARHGTQDFFIINLDSIRQTMESTTATLTMLISAIALISLVVGGIGVMNIMLVSVTERTGEIGVRMAVGARPGDIMQQFLIEAVLVCLAGGVLGILGAWGLGALVAQADIGFKLVHSTQAMVLAFACASLIGVLFGFLPARSAARLDPVAALARE